MRLEKDRNRNESFKLVDIEYGIDYRGHEQKRGCFG